MIWVLVVYVKETKDGTEENTIAPQHIQEQAMIQEKVTSDELLQESEKEKVAAGKTGYTDRMSVVEVEV